MAGQEGMLYLDDRTARLEVLAGVHNSDRRFVVQRCCVFVVAHDAISRFFGPRSDGSTNDDVFAQPQVRLWSYLCDFDTMRIILQHMSYGLLYVIILEHE